LSRDGLNEKGNLSGETTGGEEAGRVMGDYSEGLDWMDERWVVGQTVEEVNELWETRRCAGWWAGEGRQMGQGQ
jgi:hypothetical protein